MSAKRRAMRLSFSTAGAVVAIATLGIADLAAAQALGTTDRGYIGPSFLQVPGVKGDSRDPTHKRWVAINAHYWKVEKAARAGGLGRRRTVISMPAAPRQGAGTLVLAIDKRNPALSSLMARCNGKAVMPEATYSVTPERGRVFVEIGERPASVPEHINFKLKDVQFVDCPVVDKAPEQAIVVKFGNIEWLNWQQPAPTVPIELQPAALKAAPSLSGATKSWVLTWIAVAHDVSDDQCPKMAEKPTEPDYYALMSKEEADKERAALAGQGGPNYENGQMGRRGPSRLDVTLLPGIVADPVMPEPQTTVARGLDLDNGKGPKHREYVSPDGKITGIDNQLYTAKGCVAGWQGHKGFITQFANNQMRDGQYSLLFEVSGIDDEQNDNEVYVTILYSPDAMVKSGSGGQILADYSFPLSSNPEFTHYFSRLRGQIVDGVLITEPVEKMQLNLGVYGTPPELKLADARMRIELRPDGTIKGVLGGYTDWREAVTGTEFYFGFQSPALYNALKRNADGMKNPVTGEYDGISTAYDIEGVPAFVVATPQNIASANSPEGNQLARNAP